MALKGTRLAAALGVATLLAAGGAPAAHAACEYNPNFSISKKDRHSGELGSQVGCFAGQLLGVRIACGENYRDTATGKFCIPEDLKPKKKEDQPAEEESDQQKKPALGGGGGGSRGGGSTGGGIWFFPGSSFGYSGTVTVGPAETVQK